MVGLVLVSHPGIASAMAEQARVILHRNLEDIGIVEIQEKHPEAEQAMQQAIASADQGDGVLVLTDLPCATPSNIALKSAGDNTRVISGLNLSMLIRACNYADRGLEQLANIAMEGARKGVSEIG